VIFLAWGAHIQPWNVWRHNGIIFSVTLAAKRKLVGYSNVLVVELGMDPQPFQLDFKWYGNLVTHSCLKRVWEKVFLFGIIIEVSKPDIKPTQE
jgi:hypothetical protein